MSFGGNARQGLSPQVWAVAERIAEQEQPLRPVEGPLNRQRARNAVGDRLPAIDVLIVEAIVELGLRRNRRDVQQGERRCPETRA
jgi:hypothetical protein